MVAASLCLPEMVVFDLDGTLVDHRGAACQGLRAWLDGFGVSWRESVEAAWFAAERRHFASWRQGRISFAEQRRERLREILPLIGQDVGDDEALDAAFATYAAAYEAAWSAYPDAEPALRALRRPG